MKTQSVDLVIIGAGPVGLMCAYLSQLCGLSTVVVDKSEGPLKVGRADALNARTLQLLELADLFKELHPLGKPCNTSSVWTEGKFVSRQSTWWENLEGCFHKHFLMIGQSYVENLLDKKLQEKSASVKRQTSVENIEVNDQGCLTTFSNGDKIKSKYVIGADGSRSFVREKFQIPFEVVRPQIVWAVIDGVIETDFQKVPEIIVFQNETSDVAWIPREGQIDRFYIRMDTKEFTFDEAVEKINRAMRPHKLSFKEVEWFSHFSVKESVAENFFVHDRVFLAGDSCHIHSVNGGQGLNTGLADAFNLIWKLSMVINHGASHRLLQSYQDERKPVAQSVIEASGELVRATKFSESGTHAQDYVKIVQKRAGNITGMGIQYRENKLDEKNRGSELAGTRLFDFEVNRNAGNEDGKVAENEVGKEAGKTRVYSLLGYSEFTLIICGDKKIEFKIPKFVKVLHINTEKVEHGLWTKNSPYRNRAILVRPDSYIMSSVALDQVEMLFQEFKL